MRLKTAIATLVLSCLGSVACTSGGPATGTSLPDGGSADNTADAPPSSNTPTDGGGAAKCVNGCADGQVCSGGSCVDLPKTCPCPAESYCDIATNSCEVGCTRDEECSKGRYCEQDTRTCKDGCRTASDCTTLENTHCDPDTRTCQCNAGSLFCGGQCSPCPTIPNVTTYGCSGDACVPTACKAGLTLCGGVCVDTTHDKANCGACGNDCGTWASSKGIMPQYGVCSNSACGGVVSISASRHNCNDACASVSLHCGPQIGWSDCSMLGVGCGVYYTSGGSRCQASDNVTITSCTQTISNSKSCYFTSTGSVTGFANGLACFCQ